MRDFVKEVEFNLKYDDYPQYSGRIFSWTNFIEWLWRTFSRKFSKIRRCSGCQGREEMFSLKEKKSLKKGDVLPLS